MQANMQSGILFWLWKLELLVDQPFCLVSFPYIPVRTCSKGNQVEHFMLELKAELSRKSPCAILLSVDFWFCFLLRLETSDSIVKCEIFQHGVVFLFSLLFWGAILLTSGTLRVE